MKQVFYIIALFSAIVVAFAQSESGIKSIHFFENNTFKSIKHSQILSDSIQKVFDQNPLIQTNLGFNANEHWIRLITGDTQSDEPQVLSINHFTLTEVEFFYQNSNRDWIKEVYGHQLPLAAQNLNDINPLILLEEVNISDTLYVRLKTNGSLSLPLELSTLSEYVQFRSQMNMFLGVFFGLMMVMAVYNFILYLNLGDKAYLFYVLSTLFSMATSFVLNGLGYTYFWPNLPEIDLHVYLTFAGLSIFFSSRFAAEYLRLKQTLPRANVFLWVIAAFAFFMSVLSVFYPAGVLLNYGRLMVFISFPSYLIIAGMRYARGFKPALFYMIAWIPYALGLVLVVLRGAGLVPENFITAYGMEIGGAFEAMLLSLALASRIKNLRADLAAKELEKEQFKAKVLQDQKGILEKTVKERTERLEQANATKDKFFSIIGHDLRSPMIALQGMGEKFDYFIKKGKNDKVQELGVKVDSSIGHLNHLLNNLLNWAVSQSDQMPYKPTIIPVKKLVDDTFSIYTSLAQKSDIALRDELGETHVYADFNTLSTVFRNLVSNAIKFSDRGSEVIVRCDTMGENRIKVEVEDFGSGMSANMIEKLLTEDYKTVNGQRGEKGFGLGLKLVQEFVRLNKGEMSVESIVGEGSKFIFVLPSVPIAVLNDDEAILRA